MAVVDDVTERQQAADFESGFCTEFALALHHRFGYPLELMVQRSFDTGQLYAVTHAYCLVPAQPGMAVDVTGIVDKVALLKTYDVQYADGVWTGHDVYTCDSVWGTELVSEADLQRIHEQFRPIDSYAYTGAQKFIEARLGLYSVEACAAKSMEV